MRYLMLILVGVLIVGCAAPAADWRPLNGQDEAVRTQDYGDCLSQNRRHWGWDAAEWTIWALMFPWGGVPSDPYDAGGIHRCMGRAGYEWAGHPDIGEFWSSRD